MRLRIPYWQLLVFPALMVAVGFFMNSIAVAVNGGQMPVLWPGGCAAMLAIQDDGIHQCMTHATHLKFLCDWILWHGMGVASPGDFLELGQNAIQLPCLYAWIALVIKDAN